MQPSDSGAPKLRKEAIASRVRKYRNEMEPESASGEQDLRIPGDTGSGWLKPGHPAAW